MHHDFWLYWCQLLLFFVMVKVHHIYKCPSHEQVHLSLHNVYQLYADSLLAQNGKGNMPFSKSLSPYLGVTWVQILPVNSERGRQLITAVSKCQEEKAILQKKDFEHRWIPLTRDELRKCILQDNLNDTLKYLVQLPFPQVQYGTKKKKYSKRENAMIHTYTVGQWHGLIYDAILWDLKPNERYYYRVGDKIENCWSTKRNFKAPPPQFTPSMLSPFSGNIKSLQGIKIASFATFGDMSTRPTAQQFIKQLNKDHIIDFCVHIGDFGYAEYKNLTWDCKNEDYAENKQAVWDKWFRMVESITSSMPFMAGIGNHEAGILDFGGVPFSHRFFTPNRMSMNGRLYKNIKFKSNTKLIHKRLQVDNAKSHLNSFNVQPHKNPWYWFEYGPYHCVVISSEHPYGNKSVQINWLRRHLAQFRVKNNKKNAFSPWLIVFVHRCIYSSAVDEGIVFSLKQAIEPLMVHFQVHLVIQGHDHSFERTFPIKYGAITHKNRNISANTGVPVFLLSEGTGPIYLRVGCAGLEIEPVWVNPLPTWSAYLGVHYGYARVVAYSNSSLHVEYVVTEKKYQSNNSNVFDKVIIIKR